MSCGAQSRQTLEAEQSRTLFSPDLVSSWLTFSLRPRVAQPKSGTLFEELSSSFSRLHAARGRSGEARRNVDVIFYCTLLTSRVRVCSRPIPLPPLSKKGDQGNMAPKKYGRVSRTSALLISGGLVHPHVHLDKCYLLEQTPIGDGLVTRLIVSPPSSLSACEFMFRLDPAHFLRLLPRLGKRKCTYLTRILTRRLKQRSLPC